MCFDRRKINKQKIKLFALSKKEDFKKLKKQGTCIRRGCFFLVYRSNSLLNSRFAWAFCLKGPKKAVRRNQLKRWARKFMLQKQHLWLVSLDILLGVRSSYKDNEILKKHEKFCSELENLCSRIRL